MLNCVTLIGRLVRDPELRYTPSNKATTSFTIAVDRDYKNQAGERETDFINVVLWGPSAENFAKWAKKGRLVAIKGSIRTRSYDNQNGQKVFVTEVLAESFNLLDKADNQNAGNGFAQQTPAQPQLTPNFARDESPFGNTSPMDISDDDLPF